MRTIMIIPAKGTSRRLPRKNARPFCGHPLVAWPIVQGVTAKHVDEVWVSTDDEEIAHIAHRYGAKVVIRRYKDTDETPGVVAVQEWVYRMRATGGLGDDDIFICRLCTTPTLLPWDTDGAIIKWRYFNELYEVPSMGVGAEIRTFRAARKVVDGIQRGLPKDCLCENDYGIVQHYAAFGLHHTGETVRLWERTVEQVASEAYSTSEHPRSFYYNLQPWQLTDVDTPEEWEFAEVVAEHYILRGRDMLEVYKEKK